MTENCCQGHHRPGTEAVDRCKVQGQAHDDTTVTCAESATSGLEDLSASKVVAGGIRTPIRIMAMDCPTEEAMIRKKLGAMDTVKEMEFNLMQRVLTVVHPQGALDSIMAAIRSLGFEPELAGNDSVDSATEDSGATRWQLGFSLAAAVASTALYWTGGDVWIIALLAVAAVLASGLSTFRKGWTAVSNGNLNINALMSIAVIGAMILGQWPEAAMVMVLFNVAEMIEAKSLDRARNAINGLMALAPESATVQQPDGSWRAMAVSTVAVGARVRVRPGERVGLDGEILSGQSSLNQAPITGESMPVDKVPGDTVFAGTINGGGEFEYRVTAGASNTLLARIIHSVEEAQGAKAPTQRFVDRFAQVYTPIVFGLAVAIAIIPPLVAGGAWTEWIYKALVLLVIACPCALVISTPVTIVTGLTAAARMGILIKGGVYLENGRRLARVVLDKTGTLTQGKPAQTDFEILDGSDAQNCRIAALSLASRSDHPVSQALAQAGAEDRIPTQPVTNFEALPGRGVRGCIGGVDYALGNHRMMEQLNACSDFIEGRLKAMESEGKTVVGLVSQGQVLALFAVADSVRVTSRQAVTELHQAGIRTMMLTGDNRQTAEAIARQVGIDEVRGDQLPEDKLRVIKTLSDQGSVAMVGDGINDAPALAQADIGFAMGAMGTDTAIETADVALMDDDLRKLPAFIRLSRATHSILVQNITIALAIKLVFAGLTLAGLGTMWMAVFADVGASLLVVANGLRLAKTGSGSGAAPETILSPAT